MYRNPTSTRPNTALCHAALAASGSVDSNSFKKTRLPKTLKKGARIGSLHKYRNNHQATAAAFSLEAKLRETKRTVRLAKLSTAHPPFSSAAPQVTPPSLLLSSQMSCQCKSGAASSPPRSLCLSQSPAAPRVCAKADSRGGIDSRALPSARTVTDSRGGICPRAHDGTHDAIA